MISSILDAVERRKAKAGATTITAQSLFPRGHAAWGASDGSLRGSNPGKIGVGYHLNVPPFQEPIVIAGGLLHHGTNNEAEYLAHILMLRHALRLGIWSLLTRTDSELLHRQVGGRYKVKSSRLKRLNAEAKTLHSLFSHFHLSHVPRETNVLADEISRRVVFIEPKLPPLRNVNGQVRVLHEFQAAAIRSWGLRKLASTNVMQRIFGVTGNVVEQIVKGETYRNADFNLPPLLPVVEETVAQEVA